MKLCLCDRFASHYPKFEWIETAAKKLGWKTVKARTLEDVMRYDDQVDVMLFSQRPPCDLGELSEKSKAKKSVWCAWVFDYLCYHLPLLNDVPWHAYDMVFCKQPEVLPLGVESRYLDQACPPWLPFPPHRPRPYDVLFPGRYSVRRERLVSQCIRWRLKVAVAGSGWAGNGQDKIDLEGGLTCTRLAEHTDNYSMCQLFGSARVVLGDNYDNDCHGYWSDRQYLAIAAKAVYVGPNISPMKRWLTDRNLDPEVIRECKKPEWLEKERNFQWRIVQENQYTHRLEQMSKYLSDARLID